MIHDLLRARLRPSIHIQSRNWFQSRTRTRGQLLASCHAMAPEDRSTCRFWSADAESGKNRARIGKPGHDLRSWSEAMTRLSRSPGHDHGASTRLSRSLSLRSHTGLTAECSKQKRLCQAPLWQLLMFLSHPLWRSRRIPCHRLPACTCDCRSK